MRPHVQIPGTGDTYVWNGRALTINGTPVAEIEPGPPQIPKLRKHERVPLGPVDPQLAEERAAIGAVILGWCLADHVEMDVVHPDHRRILLVLASVALGAEDDREDDRLERAILWCRGRPEPERLPRELVGRYEASHCMGYFAGCVRDARAQGEVGEARYRRKATGERDPVASVDPAEDWERG